MTSSKRSQDIWSIWSESSKHRKKNFSNYIILAFSIILPTIALFTNKDFSADEIRSILSVLLSLNGAVLGLIIAGYSFSNAIPRDLMSFFASTKAVDYPWSNFKQILLNYLYCYTVLFTGILIFCAFYVASYIHLQGLISISTITIIKKSIFLITWMVQGFIISELKIFLFWIYDNSLTLAQAVAVSDDHDPIDP